MIRLAASVPARRRAVAAIGVAGLVGTLLTTTGVAAQQQDDEPLTVNSPSVGESGGTLVFTVTNRAAISLTDFPSGTVEVDYNTNSGSARSGSDYTYTSGTLKFTSVGQTRQVSVPILVDELNEGDETVELWLDDPRRPSANIIATGTIRDDDPLPKLTLGEDDQVTERGGVLWYAVTLSEPSGREVRVPFEVLPGLKRDGNGNLIDPTDCGSATDSDVCQPTTAPPSPDADYKLFGDSVVFYPGETGREPNGRVLIGVYTVNDDDVDVDDRDETFTLRLIRDEDNPSFDFATPEDETAEGLILDDDLPRISISQWGGGPEGPYATNWGVRVSRRSAAADNVTVMYRTVDDGRHIPGQYSSQDEGEAHCSAKANQDFVPVSGKLTFTPNDSFLYVETTKLDDEIAEPVAERICLELYEQSRNALLELEPVWYNIIYDDEDPPSVSVTSPDVDEGDGSVTFSVALVRPGTDPVELTYSTADDSAEAPGDYTSKLGTLSFRAGDMTPQNVTVRIVDDTLHEDTEDFKLVVAGVGGFQVEGTATITDNDGPPRLSVTPATADEDAANRQIDFTVTLAGASSRLVMVDYATEVAAGDTATEGTACGNTGVDYTATSDSLDFQAEQTGPQTVSVPICNDSLYEGNETFTLRLRNPHGAELTSNAAAKGTIVDDEQAPSFSVADATAPESAGYVDFEVTLASQVDSEVTVDYATVELTSGSNRAAKGTDCFVSGDYEDTSGTVTFLAGDVSETVSVPICRDDTDEEDETFRLTLSNPSSNIPIASGKGTATGTIEDSDDPPLVSVAAVAEADEADTNPAASFEVTVSPASGKTVTVRYSTADDTASAGADYTAATNRPLTFAPGETTKPISVPVRDDTLDEADQETFTLTLSDQTNAILGVATATGTINDDDDPPSLSFDRDVTAAENAGTMAFTVRLSAASGRLVKVDYATADDTADDTATAGLDYIALTSGRLRFEPGDPLTKTISVQILNDALDEADAETFTLELYSPFNATLSSDPLTATGTITDNDADAELSVENATATEGGTVTFTVTLDPLKDADVEVSYSTSNDTATRAARTAPVTPTSSRPGHQRW